MYLINLSAAIDTTQSEQTAGATYVTRTFMLEDANSHTLNLANKEIFRGNEECFKLFANCCSNPKRFKARKT